MQMNDFVVRFAGEGGQGVVTSAEGLAQASTQVGYHALTYATFPSQILGGPTWTQARIRTEPVLSSGDEIDVLVAFNEEAYETHAEDVREGGVIIYNADDFTMTDPRSFGLAIDTLARSTGNNRAANMVVIGALAQLVHMPQQYLEDFVEARFRRGRDNDDEIISSNIEAMRLGRQNAAESGFVLGDLAPPNPPDYTQMMLKGNEAIALGATHAGLKFYAGYPISPATTILLWMERNLVGEDKFAYQVSSEIEAITAILGAGFAGKKSMTATAGPGVSLMSEGLGLAWMAEIPLVVVDVQRGGPATGLPTKTEQSDLMGCMYPAHGDVRMPIIAPGSVEECFYAAAQAINWAERYQGPVILMSEMSMAERVQNIPRPDITKVPVEERLTYEGANGYHRYSGYELSPHAPPRRPRRLRRQRQRARRDGRHHPSAQPPYPDDRATFQQAQAPGRGQLRTRQHRRQHRHNDLGRLQGAGAGSLRPAPRARPRCRLVLLHVPEPAAASLARGTAQQGPGDRTRIELPGSVGRASCAPKESRRRPLPNTPGCPSRSATWCPVSKRSCLSKRRQRGYEQEEPRIRL